MATKAELTKKVDDLTAAATAARTAWKQAIPGPDDPKMTDDEQAEVDKLEEAYTTAKAARGAAEKELAAWITAQAVAASAGTPVNVPAAPTGEKHRLANGVIVGPEHPAYSFGKPF